MSERLTEKWRDIKGFEGEYQVSSIGRIRSFKNKINSEPMIMKTNINVKGYPIVSLCKNGKCKTYTIHRLVANAFIPNPYEHKTINHIDGDPTNNILSNLEWCSQSHNTIHSIYKKIERLCKSSKSIFIGW